MSIRKASCLVLLSISFWATQLAADNVFVLPQAGAGGAALAAYTGDPFNNLASVQVNPRPFLVVPKSDGSQYYLISKSATRTVVVYDFSQQKEITSFDLGSQAQAAVLTPDGAKLLVLAGTLQIINTADNTLTPNTPFTQNQATTDLGQTPTEIVVTPDSKFAYVLSPASAQLSKVDLQKLTVPVKNNTLQNAFYLSLSPTGLLFVTGSNSFYQIDPNVDSTKFTILKSVALNGKPGRLAFSPDGTRALAANLNGVTPQLFIFDPVAGTLLGSVVNQVGEIFDQIFFTSLTTALGHTTDRQIFTIDTKTAKATLASFGTGGQISQPQAIAVSREVPSPTFLYIATPTNVFRIDLSQNNQVGSPLLAPASVGGAQFAGPADTGTPASIQGFNTSQTLKPGAISAPLVVEVLDASGKPLSNSPVTFNVGNTGAAVVSAMTTTNIQGFATAVVQTPATGAVLNIVATSSGASQTFTLTTGSGGGGGGGGEGGGGTGGVAILSGNGLLLPEGASSATSPPFVIKVTDDKGNPVPDIVVTWSVNQPSAAGGGVIADNPLNVQRTQNKTDANGIAKAFYGGGRVPFGHTFVQDVVTAATAANGSATLYATSFSRTNPATGASIPPPNIFLLTPAVGATLVGQSGVKLPGAIQVKVLGGASPDLNVPIPNVGVELLNSGDASLTPPATCSGGVALTQADTPGTPNPNAGVANCDVVPGGTVGTFFLTIQVGGIQDFQGIRIQVNPGPPVKFTSVSGDQQSGNPGATLQPLVAKLVDGGGSPSPNVAVTWSVSNANGVSLSNVTTKTDANGEVSAVPTLGSVAGTHQVTAKAGSLSVTFSVTVNITLGGLSIVSGDGQTAQQGANFGAALVVAATDSNNNPLAGQAVTFAVSGPGAISATSATTNAQGQASVSATAGAAAGAVTVTATLGSKTVTFHLTVVPPGPVVTLDSFLNGAGFKPEKPGVGPGAITTIMGPGLAPGVQNCVVANGGIIGPLPYVLQNVQITFGNSPAPIYMVCNVGGQEQVTVQTPFDLTPGTTTDVKVQVGNGSTTVNNVPVLSYQPAVFQSWAPDGSHIPALIRPDGSYVSAQNPARPGDIITLFATGLGQVTPSTATNLVGIGGQSVAATLVVGVNNAGVRVVSSEYELDRVGLYTVKFEVPQGTPAGNVPLAVAVVENNTLVFGNSSAMPVGQ